MNGNRETLVGPIKVSSNKFGVLYENKFVLLGDAEHFIGLNPTDAKILILENVVKGSKVEFGGSSLFNFYISTMIFDEDTGSLYRGDNHGQLVQYKVNTASQTCEEVRDYGKLGIGEITSSHRFLHFIFFGGSDGKIRVLDMSTCEFLPGHIDTSISKIISLQVCVKTQKEIYMAVSGEKPDYSNDKTDLFDISGLLSKDPVMLRKFLSNYPINRKKTNSKLQSKMKSQADSIKKLTQERDSYKVKLNEMTLKYNKLKKKYDELRNKNKDIKKAYKKLKIDSEIKQKEFTKKMNLLYQHRNKRTTIGNKMPLIGSGLFDQIDPLVIIRDLKEDLEEKKYKYKKLEGSMYDVLAEKKTVDQESQAKDDRINLLKNELATIKQVVGNR